MTTTRTRGAILATAVGSLGLTAVCLAPAASAAPIEAAAISPTSQTVKEGDSAIWGGAVSGGKATYHVTFTYGDGSSRTFNSSAASWGFDHAYRFCTARSKTFTQKLTVTDGYGVTTTATSKVTATYSGPICS